MQGFRWIRLHQSVRWIHDSAEFVQSVELDGHEVVGAQVGIRDVSVGRVADGEPIPSPGGVMSYPDSPTISRSLTGPMLPSTRSTTPSRSTNSASAATPAEAVNDPSGAPKRTRFLPGRRLRILFTDKVPLPLGHRRLQQPRFSLQGGHLRRLTRRSPQHYLRNGSDTTGHALEANTGCDRDHLRGPDTPGREQVAPGKQPHTPLLGQTQAERILKRRRA